jgi:homoserine O-acetyltransferase
MAALLTYRSRDSFESRFGRNTPDRSRQQNINGQRQPNASDNDHFSIHNEGHKRAGLPRVSTSSGAQTPITSAPPSPRPMEPLTRNKEIPPQSSVNTTTNVTITDPQFHGATPLPTSASVQNALDRQSSSRRGVTTHFSAQSYLRYQGEKFISRFDANCYIAITRKLDTHDISLHCEDLDSKDPLHEALGLIQQPTLVLGIESDGLFTFAEQQQIAAGIKGARLEKIESKEGHDAFLLQFEQVNRYILEFLKEALPDIMGRPGDEHAEQDNSEDAEGKVTKNSTFGEAEVEDITAW